MTKENAYQNGLKRVKAAQQKIVMMRRAKGGKAAEVLAKSKHLMHFASSFVSILFLTVKAIHLLTEKISPETYQTLMTVASETLTDLLAMPNFVPTSKKQMHFMVGLAYSF